ncbi:MAG: hypothetical protein WC028_29485 [Candidatus Obscuribacterales bacterium]|jgi:hypothetical protein
MAQRKSEEKITVDQVLRLVDQLSPEEQGKLRHKLDESWSAEWRALLKEVDEQNKDTLPLSEEEILAEVKDARQEMKAERARKSSS